MTTRRLHPIVLIATVTGTLATTAWAQQPGDPGLSPTTMPIEIAAIPSKTTPSGVITLRGTTGLVGDKSQVTIQVTPPGAKPPLTLTAKPDAKGGFSTAFAGTKELGTYQVAATAPDGKGQAKTSFAVVATGAIPAEVVGRIEALVAKAGQALDLTRKRLETLPISPPREQAREKLQVAEQRLKQAPAQIATVKKAMTQAFEARAKVKEPVPEWDQYLGELTTWDQQAQSSEARLEQAAAPTAQAAAGCADLQLISDGLGQVSELLSLVQVPIDKSASFWADKASSGIVARTSGPTTPNSDKYLAVQGLKLATALLQGPKGWITAAAGAIVDAGQFIVNQTFAQYCVKFEGPVRGTFLGEAYTSKGEFWWSYTIELDGKITLSYPKDAPAGKPVTLVGWIEGAAQFQMRDDPTPINRLIPGTVLFHRVTAPTGAPYLAELGPGFGGASPHAYHIPLKGILAGDSILITVMPAVSDFSDIIQGHLIWVVMPLGGMWPEIINAPVKFQKAQPIFERVIRRKPVLKVERDGDLMVARGQFARDTTTPDGGAHVTTTVTIKACNPGCLPLPLGPAGKP